MRELHDRARALPGPTAILVVSAHRESDALGTTSTAPTELVHDFGGSHPVYHREVRRLVLDPLSRDDVPRLRSLALRLLAGLTGLDG